MTEREIRLGLENAMRTDFEMLIRMLRELQKHHLPQLAAQDAKGLESFFAPMWAFAEKAHAVVEGRADHRAM